MNFLFFSGIYKQDYINELFKRYGDPSDKIPQIKIFPTWDDNTQEEDDDGDGNNQENGNTSGENVPPKKRKREFIKPNAQFAIPIGDVQVVNDMSEVHDIQVKVQNLCGWEK